MSLFTVLSFKPCHFGDSHDPSDLHGPHEVANPLIRPRADSTQIVQVIRFSPGKNVNGKSARPMILRPPRQNRNSQGN